MQQAQFTNSRCGQGVGGAACITCVGGERCETLLAGVCVGGGGTGGGGGGGGGTPFPDGGFDLCGGLGTPCTASQCCDVDAIFGLIPTCYSQGQACGSAGICRPNNVCQ